MVFCKSGTGRKSVSQLFSYIILRVYGYNPPFHILQLYFRKKSLHIYLSVRIFYRKHCPSTISQKHYFPFFSPSIKNIVRWSARPLELRTTILGCLVPGQREMASGYRWSHLNNKRNKKQCQPYSLRLVSSISMVR